MSLSYTYDPKSWNQQIRIETQSPDVNAIVTADTYTGGALPINGSQSQSGGYYYTAMPAFLTLNCTGDETGNTFTFTGSDQSGRTYIYSTPGVNADSIVIPIPFNSLQVGSIVMTNDSADNVSVGISAQTATPWCPIDTKRSVDSLGFFVFVDAETTPNYTLQYTNDPFQGEAKGYPTAPINFIADQILSDIDISNSSGLNNPAQACRIIINSGSGGLLFQLQQQGDFTSAPTSIGV